MRVSPITGLISTQRELLPTGSAMKFSNWLMALRFIGNRKSARSRQRRRRHDSLRRQASGLLSFARQADELETRCLLAVTTVDLGFFTPPLIGSSEELVLNASNSSDTLTLSAASEAEAETGLFSNGSAGLALAFQFSDEDVTAEIHGTMTADMNHPDGAVVKLEFDPTTQIDFAADTINAGSNWVVVTEDTVSYQNRRGATIGGLTSGQDYYIIRVLDKPSTPEDESNGGANVRLAETEQKAIDGGLWELDDSQTGRNPFAVDLSGGGTLNTRGFNSSDVDATNNTISIDPGIGPFELGQSVIYREDDLAPTDVIIEDGNGGYLFADPDGNPLRDANGNLIPHTPAIPGLIHGTIYWTLSSPNQFALQGDNRIVDRQVLQLGALENEVRGGNIIEIGTPTPGKGFSLNGVQVLDLNLLTFGVVTSIDATDSATATAGLSSADDFASTDPPGVSEIGSAIFGDAFGKLAAKNPVCYAY